MEALGSTARLNGLKLRIQSTIPNVPHEKESAYKATEAHLMNSWKILLAFIIIEAVFAYVAMTKISNVVIEITYITKQNPFNVICSL